MAEVEVHVFLNGKESDRADLFAVARKVYNWSDCSLEKWEQEILRRFDLQPYTVGCVRKFLFQYFFDENNDSCVVRCYYIYHMRSSSEYEEKELLVKLLLFSKHYNIATMAEWQLLRDILRLERQALLGDVEKI